MLPDRTMVSVPLAVHQTILSCSSGSKSPSLVVGRASSSLPGRGVLMWTPANEESWSLPSGGGLSLVSGSEGFSGMKRATRKATTTVQAPNRKGGPGMRAFCGRREREGSV